MFGAFPKALVLLLLLGSSVELWAAPRTVAIVNLSQAEVASQLASQARNILDRAPDLRPSTPGNLARALENALPQGGLEGPALAEAASAITSSEDAFAEFKSRQARTELTRARRLLFSLAPSDKTNELLADVSFHMALIHLREENNGLAMGELQLLHRLVERPSIDQIRYAPNVVKAFRKARTTDSKAQRASLNISATYDGAPVFIDGKPSGVTPLSISVAPGAHVVAIAAPQYQAAATLIDIDPGATQEPRIDLEPRSPVVRALELRYAASAAGLSDEDLRTAAGRVSRLVGSDAVLLIVNDKSTASGTSSTLYLPHLDALSFRQPVGPGLKRMLGLVSPVPRPTLLDGTGGLGPLPWYRKRWGIAAIGGGTALAIVTLVTLGTGSDTQTAKGVIEFFPDP